MFYQECKFRLGSYQYNVEQMTFLLAGLDQDLARQNILLEYMRVTQLQAPDDIFTWREIGNYSISGFRSQIHICIYNFSSDTASFPSRLEMKRRSFKFFFNNYIPCAMFVVVSWVSFLIPPDLIPGRSSRLAQHFSSKH